MLDAARALEGHGYIEVDRNKSELTFLKVVFFSLNKGKVIRLAKDAAGREKYRAKIYGITPKIVKIKKINIPRSKVRVVTNQASEGTLKMDMEKETETWDVFISHASEDKDSIARPLKEALESEGVKVWFDESELKIGDRLHKSIDKGIANSGYGIVILSENFFKKDWPQRELEGLVAKEYEGRKIILPVWHKVDAAFIRSKSILLAGILGVPSSKGIGFITQEVLKVIKPGGQTPAKPIPPIQLPKGKDSRRSILEGTINSLQKLEVPEIKQTINDMEFDVLKQNYSDLLEGIALFDLGGKKEHANLFIFLQESVLERSREEGAEIFELLLNWYFSTTTALCKEQVLEIISTLIRSPDLKEVAIKHKADLIAEFGRSDSFDIAGTNAAILQNIKSSLTSNDCVRIVNSALSNGQINCSFRARQTLQKVLPSCEGKVDPRKLEELYKLLSE